MSDTTSSDTAVLDAETTEVDTPHAEDEHGDHASDSLYIQIALVLAVLTGMEVAWPYITDGIFETDGPLLMFPLLVVMGIKFWIIGSFFMHLKFDAKVLTRVFYMGLFLAVGVYIAALCTFQIFGF